MGGYQYQRYVRNRMCGCARCRFRSASGAFWLVGVGLLFLLDTVGGVRIHNTWPLFLIMAGLYQVLVHNLSDEGHIQPGWYPVAPGQPTAPPPQAPPSSGQGASNV